jgi:hypothetical protein
MTSRLVVTLLALLFAITSCTKKSPPHSSAPSLASRFDPFDFVVRRWSTSTGAPLAEDLSLDALTSKMRDEPPRSLVFAFGIDPNEVDLEGRVLTPRDG